MVSCVECGLNNLVQSDFCPMCGHILEISNIDLFAVFGLNTQFQLDIEVLKRSFLEKMQKFHPDMYINKSATQLTIATKNSSIINNAYKIISDPISRALYIFELKNISIPNDDKFLLEVMEWNEKIEEISSIEELKKLINEVGHLISSYILEMSEMFKCSEYNKAATKYSKVKFFTRILNLAKKKL